MHEQRRPVPGMDSPEVIGLWVREMQQGVRTIGPAEMGFFLLTSAPALLAMGEPEPDDDHHNLMLWAWWDRMNGLPYNIKVVVQTNIRTTYHDLPPAPWEEVGPDGQPV